MCTMTDKGYRMTDGTIIAFDSDMSSISVKHIKELEEQGKWEHFIIQTKMHCLEDKLEQIPQKVSEMITITINSMPKTLFNKWAERIKAFAALLTALAILGGAILYGSEMIYKVKHNLSNEQIKEKQNVK